MYMYDLEEVIGTYKGLTDESERKSALVFISKLTGIEPDIISDLTKGTEHVIERIKEMMTEDVSYSITEDGSFFREIYVDYYEKCLSDDTMTEIFSCEDPERAYLEWLGAKNLDAWDYEWNYVVNDIENCLSEKERMMYEANKCEIQEAVKDFLNIGYKEDAFTGDVFLDIGIDSGDSKYDYTLNNITNYCGTGKIDEHSSILWLCRQQEKEAEFRANIRDEECYKDDPFISSVREELDNLSSPLGCLTFLVKTDLKTAFRLFKEYNNKKVNHTIILGKDTECGLFDFVNGGGSLIGIELDKDVEIPIDQIGRIVYDSDYRNSNKYDLYVTSYSISYVYGVNRSMWRKTLKIS